MCSTAGFKRWAMTDTGAWRLQIVLHGRSRRACVCHGRGTSIECAPRGSLAFVSARSHERRASLNSRVWLAVSEGKRGRMMDVLRKTYKGARYQGNPRATASQVPKQ